MYLYIDTLKQRLDTINRLRVNRALAIMGPDYQRVYSLLPILLHFHHPMLPGYLDSSVPHGISFYIPDRNQRTWLDTIGNQINISQVVTSDNNDQPITGVYSMGSTSSIGQNINSDLDIWVCHKPWLNDKERAQLQLKCTLLEQWATKQGVDVNFFLIDENLFRYSKSSNIGDKYHNTNRYFLLLDEFYRTAVRMGGKRIIWNIVPKEAEENYDEYILSLYANGVLTPNEWLDLGNLSNISAEEYFIASLWQIYKIFESPYKAVLKILLLEAYYWEYPHTELLAMHIKQRLHNGEIVAYGLDPYCMMLERVTCYLIQVNDMTRLDIVRCCFYLKVCDKLSQHLSNNAWRQKILSKLVQRWGWDKEYLYMLDNYCINKQKDQMREIHKALLDIVIQSYHKLINFARRNNLNINANQQDTRILIRKLYAAIEELPSKITLFNL